jgi:hypothetical protein
MAVLLIERAAFGKVCLIENVLIDKAYSLLGKRLFKN